MNFFRRAFTRETSSTDEKYNRAMKLSEEVSETLRNTARDPFTVIALDLAREVLRDGADPALVADAYEQIQESKIFQGLARGDAQDDLRG